MKIHSLEKGDQISLKKQGMRNNYLWTVEIVICSPKSSCQPTNQTVQTKKIDWPTSETIKKIRGCLKMNALFYRKCFFYCIKAQLRTVISYMIRSAKGECIHPIKNPLKTKKELMPFAKWGHV